MNTVYKVIKTFYTHVGEVPITLPVGTKLTFWENRGFYLSEAVNNCCVAVPKWTVEAWWDYFEKVKL